MNDPFDEIARTAGAELRRPAPHGGLDRLVSRANRQQRNRRVMTGVAAVCVIAGGFAALTRGGDDDVETIPATVTSLAPSPISSTAPSLLEPSTTTSTTQPPAITTIPSTVQPAWKPLSPQVLPGLSDGNRYALDRNDRIHMIDPSSRILTFDLLGTPRAVPFDADGEILAIFAGPIDVLYVMVDPSTEGGVQYIGVSLDRDDTGRIVSRSPVLPYDEFTVVPTMEGLRLVDRRVALPPPPDAPLVLAWTDHLGRPAKAAVATFRTRWISDFGVEITRTDTSTPVSVTVETLVTPVLAGQADGGFVVFTQPPPGEQAPAFVRVAADGRATWFTADPWVPIAYNNGSMLVSRNDDGTEIALLSWLAPTPP